MIDPAIQSQRRSALLESETKDLAYEVSFLKSQLISNEKAWKQERAVLEQSIQLQELQMKESKYREDNLRKMNETFMQTISDFSNDSKRAETQSLKDFKEKLEEISLGDGVNHTKRLEQIAKIEEQNRELKNLLHEKTLEIRNIQHDKELVLAEKQELINKITTQTEQLEKQNVEERTKNHEIIAENQKQLERMAKEIQITRDECALKINTSEQKVQQIKMLFELQEGKNSSPPQAFINQQIDEILLLRQQLDVLRASKTQEEAIAKKKREDLEDQLIRVTQQLKQRESFQYERKNQLKQDNIIKEVNLNPQKECSSNTNDVSSLQKQIMRVSHQRTLTDTSETYQTTTTSDRNSHRINNTKNSSLPNGAIHFQSQSEISQSITPRHNLKSISEMNDITLSKRNSSQTIYDFNSKERDTNDEHPKRAACQQLSTNQSKKQMTNPFAGMIIQRISPRNEEMIKHNILVQNSISSQSVASHLKSNFQTDLITQPKKSDLLRLGSSKELIPFQKHTSAPAPPITPIATPTLTQQSPSPQSNNRQSNKKIHQKCPSSFATLTHSSSNHFQTEKSMESNHKRPLILPNSVPGTLQSSKNKSKSTIIFPLKTASNLFNSESIIEDNPQLSPRKLDDKLYQIALLNQTIAQLQQQLKQLQIEHQNIKVMNESLSNQITFYQQESASLIENQHKLTKDLTEMSQKINQYELSFAKKQETEVNLKQEVNNLQLKQLKWQQNSQLCKSSQTNGQIQPSHETSNKPLQKLTNIVTSNSMNCFKVRNDMKHHKTESTCFPQTMSMQNKDDTIQMVNQSVAASTQIVSSPNLSLCLNNINKNPTGYMNFIHEKQDHHNPQLFLSTQITPNEIRNSDASQSLKVKVNDNGKKGLLSTSESMKTSSTFSSLPIRESLSSNRNGNQVSEQSEQSEFSSQESNQKTSSSSKLFKKQQSHHLKNLILQDEHRSYHLQQFRSSLSAKFTQSIDLKSENSIQQSLQEADFSTKHLKSSELKSNKYVQYKNAFAFE